MKYFSYSSITLVSAVFVSALLLISVYFKVSYLKNAVIDLHVSKINSMFYFQITDDYLYKVKLVSASIIITSALFMYCYAGDLLYEMVSF